MEIREPGEPNLRNLVIHAKRERKRPAKLGKTLADESVSRDHNLKSHKNTSDSPLKSRRAWIALYMSQWGGLQYRERFGVQENCDEDSRHS